MSDRNILAIDIGGTAIKSGLWTGDCLEQIKETDTQASQGAEHMMGRVRELICSYEDYAAIGISTTGEVNSQEGSIYYANSNIPGYTGTQVKRLLEEEFGVPVAVENDVNSVALGELWKGAARGKRDFLCLTYGTGVGGSIVIDGRIYKGSSHCAGGFGGIVIHPELASADDLLAGCYERCASTTGLIRRVRLVDETLDTGRKIFANKNREDVREQIDLWIGDICTGLVTLISIFNPTLIVLGGGVMAQDYVISEVRRKTLARVAPELRGLEIVPAMLSNSAGMIGAVSLVSKQWENDVRSLAK